jgi:hypothetical protein
MKAILAVKIVQVLKLKSNATTQFVDFLLEQVNKEKASGDFFEVIYNQMEKKNIFPSDKERWVFNALPHFHAVR